MARRFFGERQYRDNFGFRWRGGEISRIEGFSDAVFAFSIALLIVTLEVPKTFAELMNTMKSFLAFAASFAILLWIWHIHYLFFRRYGLQDAFVKTVNAILLFVVLFYVYPLKFVFTNVIQFMSGGDNSVQLATGQVVPIIQAGENETMMVVYGIGFIAVFLAYTILYWYAYRKREELRLSELETYVTRVFMRNYVICIGVGLLSIGIAVAGGDEYAYLSGFSYALLGPFLGIHGFATGSKIKKMKDQLSSQHPPQQQHHQARHQGQPQRGQHQGRQQQQQRQQRPRPQHQRQRQGPRQHQGPKPQQPGRPDEPQQGPRGS